MNLVFQFFALVQRGQHLHGTNLWTKLATYGKLNKLPIEQITIWLFNIAMGNGPFIDGLPWFTY
jgi:hypothetical protein